ncbi:MAG: hypothetical protein U9R42_04265 [Bacteroidota bacterium]|nr:hypothetical protein [Bacteroidota bacterium]
MSSKTIKKHQSQKKTDILYIGGAINGENFNFLFYKLIPAFSKNKEGVSGKVKIFTVLVGISCFYRIDFSKNIVEICTNVSSLFACREGQEGESKKVAMKINVQFQLFIY